MNLINLIKVYAKYCQTENLSNISADEQTDLNPEQQEWINNYIRVWDLRQSIDQDLLHFEQDPFIQSLNDI